MALPSEPYPATIEVERTTSLVSYRANRYSVMPGLEGSTVTIRHRVGWRSLEVVSRSGLEATHRVPLQIQLTRDPADRVPGIAQLLDGPYRWRVRTTRRRSSTGGVATSTTIAG